MESYSVEQVIQAWSAPIDEKIAEAPAAVQQSFELTDKMLKLLAEGRPVAPERLAASVNQPVEYVRPLFEQYKDAGGEFDQDGNLVGAALTLIPTPYRFRVNGHDLYTWCSLDALLIPGLIDTTAVVESACPVTKEPIKLIVSPNGVASYEPAGTVLSIAIPGVSCRTGGEGAKTGPDSDACRQMHFFSSREAAEEWLQGQPGIAIFTVEEAWHLADRNWIARRSRILTEEGS